MAKKAPVVPDTFKFLEADEIDNIIRNRVSVARKEPWTEPEIMMRNQVIIDLIGQGLSRRRIQEEIMSRWGIKTTAAKDYIKDAYDALLRNNEEYIAYQRDQQVERLETIISEALEAHEYKAAVMATAELNKLLGLTINQKVTLENVDRVFKFGGES